jgi:excisionase family DNA binding protein
MTPALDPETLYPRKALQKRVPLSLRTLDRAMAEGELPYLKIGNRVLVKEADIAAWLESHRRCLQPAPKRVRAAA